MRPIKIAVLLALLSASVGLLISIFAPRAGASGLKSIVTSADGIWETLQTRPSNGALFGATSLLRLNKDALVQQLARAPLEGSADLRQSRLILFLPAPDGSMQRFQVEESPIMEPSLAARLPAVRTYRGRGLDDATISTRFDLTPQGLHALVLSVQGSTYIEPASPGETTSYVTHSGPTLPEEVFKCGVSAVDEADAVARGVYSQSGKSDINAVTNGSTLRTYRLAIATTGEWFGIYGGGSVVNAQTTIASMINLVDAIYEREIAIRFTLVNNTSIIFTNPSSDPYSTNAADSTTLGENQTTLDNLVGSANYDVGHVFGGITGLGSGSAAFSGLASIGVTCTGGSKGRGVSTMGNNPASATTGIFIGGIAHEIGHEFSATHTFNATTGGCNGQRDATSAYEVGGGSTLMSYQICGTENLQAQSDQYFHVRSLEQIVNYATTNGLCASTGATGNNAPIVTGPGNFTIPANTPFQLTATASDTNGSLTYSWEEYDLGAGSPPDTDDGSRPIFRGYKPVSVPTRYFPSLQYILNNANVPSTTTGSFLTGESLPTTSRSMNFQLVVRDNQSNGGAINTATSVLTVVNTAGPFIITAPNGGENWSGVHNVTWNVANTSNAPISAANVKITLSTDGGQSFPYTLATSVPNVGSASVTLPNGILSSACRVKVEAIGNIFFDVSNANFSLSPADTCPAISTISPKAGAAGNSVVITGVNFTGANAVIFSNNVPAAGFVVNNDTTITATVPVGASGGPITVSKAGCNGIQSSNYSFCTGGPVALGIDDGGVNGDSGAGNGAFYVNRLTPTSYPATLTQVSIFWASFQNFPAGTAINIVAGNNVGGTSTINGTTLQSFSANAGSQPGFSTYTLPSPLTISSGDFVVGFQVPTEPGGSLPAAVDTNNPQNRSYYSNNGTNFTLESFGNYMIRAAQVFTGCNAGLPTLKILSITKPPNGHIIVQCLGVPNVVNNLQAASNPSPASFVTLSPPPPTADNAGAFQYDDAAADLTKRFYRIVYP